MPRRDFTVIIVPHSGGRTVERRFSYALFRFLAGCVAFLLLAAVVLIVIAARVDFAGADYGALKKRNADLEQQLSKLDYLKTELDRMKQEDEQIRNMLGFDLQPPQLDLQQLYASLGSDSAARMLNQPDSEPLADLPRGSNPSIPSIPPLDSFTISRGLSPEHSGVDMVAEAGVRVRAAADGRVVFAGWDTIYGNAMRIQHAQGYATFYGHLLRILRLPGDSVQQGQTIGLLGSTGRSTSPHLHYEVLKQNRPQNPERYFK
jgi:murein DD-endopeptidase MepM/ murein hydrolase activator NlpD